MGYFANAGTLLVDVVFGLLLGIVLLRVLLQAARANFYNPICQALYKATNPILMPAAKVLPAVRGWNLAGIVLAWIVAILWIAALAALTARLPGFLGLLVLGLAKLVDYTLMLFFWLILIRVILSFVGSNFDNPTVPLIYKLTDPLLLPVQRVLPAPGGLDFSPLVVSVALYLGRYLIAAPLFDLGVRLA